MSVANPWEISVAEHQSNSAQFALLNPQNGRIDGNTARNVLMRSNLPPQVLAQIWALADTNRDGMLDVREFSIAMRLTRNCLSGFPLPSILPPSLMQVPAGSGPPQVVSHISAMPHPNNPLMPSFPMYHTAPTGMLGRRSSETQNGGITASFTQGRQCGNWAIPHQAKLRYSQQFNQQDKQRVGFLTGQAGRSALGMSGLPTPTLAHIWTLSDVNKDGKLTVDEFCIAMHLIDMVKVGYALPDQTPPELVQMCGFSRSASNSPLLEPGAPPAQKISTPKTFEDKRMDNFARGQAELERRRQVLMEEENRRRAEIEKREREENERKERERLEKERQRELEREAELGTLLFEVAQKQREAELTGQRLQRQKTLTFQLQALSEKAVDTDANITKARDRIAEITHEIEGMREQRDNKMHRISELQTNNQQVKSQELSHQLLQLQSANKETVTRKAELEALRKQRDAAKIMVTEMVTQKTQEYEAVRAELVKARDDYRNVLHALADLQTQVLLKLNLNSRYSVSSGNALPTLASSGNAVKYRALFEFNARSEDELSFQPGDVILVFESHAAEPGWKAGQIREKVWAFSLFSLLLICLVHFFVNIGFTNITCITFSSVHRQVTRAVPNKFPSFLVACKSSPVGPPRSRYSSSIISFFLGLFVKNSDHRVGGPAAVRLTSRGIQSLTALVHRQSFIRITFPAYLIFDCLAYRTASLIFDR
uniref:Intersectin-1 n=1 Tax=Angiostrongylus cantonensis TaxID=6313 RepID=A0A0K0CXP6_ANGCA